MSMQLKFRTLLTSVIKESKLSKKKVIKESNDVTKDFWYYVGSNSPWFIYILSWSPTNTLEALPLNLLVSNAIPNYHYLKPHPRLKKKSH